MPNELSLTKEVKLAQLIEDIEKLVKNYRYDLAVTIDKTNASDIKLKFSIIIYLK